MSNEQYLKEALDGIALSRLKQDSKPVGCVHIWKSYGLGYKCQRCGFYTGTNVVLNDLITLIEEEGGKK